MKKRIYALIIVFTLIFTSTSFAHSGRTDSSGGHKDNKNKSGLGSYHYHCGGYSAHLHKNGICPYDSSARKVTTNTNTSTNTTTKVVTTPPKQVEPKKPINIIVNGNTLENSYAIQQDGRTIVAMRPICDALDVSLDWNADTQTAKGEKGSNIFELTIGSKTAKVNGKSVTLDVAGQVKNGRTLVPVRFIAESLGAEVNFDNANNTVTITTH